MFSSKIVQPIFSAYPDADYALQMFGSWSIAMALLLLVCGVIPAIILMGKGHTRLAGWNVIKLSIGALIALGIMLAAHVYLVWLVHLLVGESYWHIHLNDLSLGDGFYQWYFWFGVAMLVGLVEVGASIWLLWFALKKLQDKEVFSRLQNGEFQAGVSDLFAFVRDRNEKPQKPAKTDDSKPEKKKAFIDFWWCLRQLWLPVIVWALLVLVANLPLGSKVLWIPVGVSFIGALLFGAKNTLEAVYPSLIVVGLLSMIEMPYGYLLLIGSVTFVFGLYLKFYGEKLKPTRKWLCVLLYVVGVMGVISLALFGFKGSIMLALWAGAVAVTSAVALFKVIWAWLPSGKSAS
jgi:hypothetical protein